MSREDLNETAFFSVMGNPDLLKIICQWNNFVYDHTRPKRQKICYAHDLSFVTYGIITCVCADMNKILPKCTSVIGRTWSQINAIDRTKAGKPIEYFIGFTKSENGLLYLQEELFLEICGKNMKLRKYKNAEIRKCMFGKDSGQNKQPLEYFPQL